MKLHCIHLILVVLFTPVISNGQTVEDYQAFASGAMEEAELLYGLTTLTDKSVQSSKSDNQLKNLDFLTYRLTNGNFKSIFWKKEPEYSIEGFYAYDPQHNLIVTEINSSPPSSEELLLIAAFNQTTELINSGDLDLKNHRTTLFPTFVFIGDLIPESHEVDPGTELVVFLMRKDRDPTVVPIGGGFYIEFDRNGKMRDVYTNDIYYSNTPKHYIHEGDTVKVALHRHTIDDPLLNPSDICSVMLNKESITWEELVTITPYNETTYLASTYNVVNHTLTISEVAKGVYDPHGEIYNLMVICGEKSFNIRSDQHDFQRVHNTIKSLNLHIWAKKINKYDSAEAHARYPGISGNQLIEVIIRPKRCEKLPMEIKNRLE